MAKEEKLALEQVEKCIEQFGEEFHRVGDSYFWYEFDAQFRLLGYLSSELAVTAAR